MPRRLVESGSRPIEGVGTSIAAFVGFCETSPFEAAFYLSAVVGGVGGVVRGARRQAASRG